MGELKHTNLGRFFITQTAVNLHYDTVKKVMGEMVVIEARFAPEQDRYLYVAISKLFDPVETGRPVPSYNLKFDNGKLTAIRI